jgi:glycerol 3-phosphatase-2
MLAERYDAFLFDLDGVLYRGASPVPHAPEALARLRASGRGIAFVTNNSSATPEVVAERLDAVGIPADASEIETSALATAGLLVHRGISRVFVVGETGIRRALAAAGIGLVGTDEDGAEAVIVGFDRGVDYEALRTASVFVERGASLIATNADASFPAADGYDWPGAGALVAAIETTTGVTAEVVGKPNAPILRAALARAGGGLPLLVGDRLDTDIAGAQALGWDSLLVLTGIATSADLATSPVVPTHVGEDLRALFALDGG